MEKPKAPPSTCPDPECDGKHSAVAKCPKFECGKCGHRVFWD